MNHRLQEIVETFEGLEDRTYKPGEKFGTEKLEGRIYGGEFDVTSAGSDNQYIQGKHLLSLAQNWYPENDIHFIFPGEGYTRVSIDIERIGFEITAESFSTDVPSDLYIEAQELSYGSEKNCAGLYFTLARAKKSSAFGLSATLPGSTTSGCWLEGASPHEQPSHAFVIE